MPRQQCPTCHLTISRCFCHMIRPVANAMPVIVLQDPREAKHALGTAQIAQLGVTQLTVLPVKPGDVESGSQLLQASLPPRAVLVYPGEKALPVSSLATKEIPHISDCALVFIDATWRRSKRILLEQPVLQQLPRYQLSTVPPTRYTLRKAPGNEALSTLEAIVEMLSCLEAERVDEYRRLLAVMDQMVDYQVRAMGMRAYLANY